MDRLLLARLFLTLISLDQSSINYPCDFRSYVTTRGMYIRNLRYIIWGNNVYIAMARMSENFEITLGRNLSS